MSKFKKNASPPSSFRDILSCCFTKKSEEEEDLKVDNSSAPISNEFQAHHHLLSSSPQPDEGREPTPPLKPAKTNLRQFRLPPASIPSISESRLLAGKSQSPRLSPIQEQKSKKKSADKPKDISGIEDYLKNSQHNWLETVEKSLTPHELEEYKRIVKLKIKLSAKDQSIYKRLIDKVHKYYEKTDNPYGMGMF